MKRRLGIIAFASLIGTSLIGVTAGTLSWFSNAQVDFGSVSGKINGAYYAGGNGSKNNPFIITHPIHLYNLAWLQYMGEYNKDQYTITDDTVTFAPDGKYDQFYFEIRAENNVLNMAGWQLPPIGTDTNPFLGHFEGNGCSIQNLTTTNAASEFSRMPRTVTSFTAPEIVGFFGVIGKLPDTASTYTYSSEINTVSNFDLNSVVVKSSTSKTLTGLAAGYVNADISGITVSGASSLSVAGQTALSGFENLSEHGLVGHTTKMGDSGSYSVDVSSQFNSEDGSGGGDDWGGSIAIDDTFNRLNTIRSTYANASKNVTIRATDTYNPKGELINSTPTVTYDITNQGNYNRVINYNSESAKTAYNNQLGSYQMGVNSNANSNGIYYLSGGHYATKQYQAYYSHSGYPIGNGSVYMTVDNRTVTTTSQIKTTSDINQALLWAFDNNGRLKTTYEGEDWYLYRYGGSNTNLRLTKTESNGIVFTKDLSADGTKYRYTFNNTHYLAPSGTYWVLDELPTLRTRPTPVSEPTAVEEPATPSEPRMSEPAIWRPATDQNINYYYIYNGDRYLTGSNDSYSSTTKSNSPNTGSNTYWDFGQQLGNSATSGTIKNVSTGRYISLERSWFFGYYYSLATSASTGNYTTWQTNVNADSNIASIYQSDASQYLSFSGNTWSNNGSNGNNVYVYSVHQAYLDWQAYDVNKALWDKYDEDKALYDQYVKDKKAYDDYLADDAKWIIEEQEYLAELAATFTLQENDYVSGVQGPDTYIDNSKTTNGMDYTGDNVTYFPLNTNADFTPANNNTGYIIGGGHYSTKPTTSTSYDIGNVRISNYYTLSESIQNYNATTNLLSNVRTYRGGDKNEIIDDANSGYVRYTESKSNAEKMLAKHDNNATGTTVKDKVYGLHFMDAVINKDYAVKAKYARFNKDVYDNVDYRMPVCSIDFRLKERGYINFFAGTYGKTGGVDQTVDAFFSLHMIRRDASGNIVSIKEIDQILSDGNEEHSYVYKFVGENSYTIPYSFNPLNQKIKYVLDTKTILTSVYPNGEHTTQNSKPTGYDTVEFNTAWIKSNSGFDQHYMYYFEMPVNEGEFCLGSVEGSAYGAYLTYLDIGAFARDNDKVQAYAVTTYSSSLPYAIGVDFAVLQVSGEGGDSIGVSIDSNGLISFTITETNIEIGGDEGIATYSYISDKRSDQTATGKFTVSGNSPGALITPSEGGDRLYHVTIDATDNSKWYIDVLDHLDESGNITGTEYPLIVCDGEAMGVNDIPASLEAYLDDDIRTLTDIVKLSRNTGKNVFNSTATFDDETKKVVRIAIDSDELDGVTIGVSDIPTGYTFSINGTAVSNGTIYPA